MMTYALRIYAGREVPTARLSNNEMNCVVAQYTSLKSGLTSGSFYLVNRLK